MPQKEQVKVVAGAPTIDGIAAFEYFIKHYNHGRPFILAGHSLGSNVMANLLAQYMKAPPARLQAHDRRVRRRLLDHPAATCAAEPVPEVRQGRRRHGGHRLLEHRGPHGRRHEPRHPARGHRHQPDHLDEEADRGERRAEPRAPSSWTRRPGARRCSTRTAASSAS